jgi:hypothetical protein
MNRREVGCIIVMGAVWFVAGLIQVLGISLDDWYERVRRK